MSSTASQLQFAAELLTLLAAAAGLVLVVLRADLTGEARWARTLLAAGFAAIGGAAFVHGALLVTASQYAGLSAGRLAGDAAVATGALRWPDRRVRTVLWSGLVLSAVAAVAGAVAHPAPAISDGLLIAGSAGLAAALGVASRRSLVARVAASAAAVLLVVVLVLSVALSAVISSSAEEDQLNALSSRAALEGSAALATAGSAIRDARFVAADLAATVPASSLSALAAGSAGGGAAVTGRLRLLSGLYPVGAMGYVVPGGRVITPAPAGAAAESVVAAARQPVVAGTTCSDSAGRSAVTVDGRLAMAVAAYPECEGASNAYLGSVVIAYPLDRSYLAGRERVRPGTGLALVTPAAVLSAAGPQPPRGTLEAVASRAERTDTAFSRGYRHYDVAVEPLPSTAAPHGAAPAVASLVASTTTSSVIAERDRLERALFLIALGGTVIALLFLAAVGDRITSGLRRLTRVAERVRRGGTGERAAIAGGDEVATLGSAFDAMVESVEEHAAALETAAADETRLRNRLQAVVAGMGDALVATDGAGTVTDFNAAAAALLGVEADQAVGRPLREVLTFRQEPGGASDPLDWPERIDPPDPASGAPRSSRPVVGAVLSGRGGQDVPVAVSVGVLEGAGGEAGGTVLVIRDLRRERELERMKSEFLARIGHELRTPLTGIIGYADLLLRRRPAAAEASQWHAQILESGKRLQRVVELLEFVATSEAGRTMVHAEAVDMRDLVRDIADDWSARLPQGMALQRRVARGTRPVNADRRWLVLALNELIDNAVKFSPAGGRIVLYARPGPGEGGVDISVADQGVGMGGAGSEEAFAEFVQGDSSDTRRFGGLGLGLAVVRRVAAAHGGSVLCRPVPGGGTRFVVRLPAASPGHPTPSRAAAVR